ncbi:hypothetical protein NHX12_025423 [Muraenolepis orangiensis]|uniref:Phosphatidylethanolamine N-methyltransferase n=1 Tax=Muraenolepis orangiensis TaxID=630683 RepID=A0A9Q0EMQ9_9TELE|nr:hypothetical protein NHX12_025423 [Muraenolepis orangiensis]
MERQEEALEATPETEPKDDQEITVSVEEEEATRGETVDNVEFEEAIEEGDVEETADMSLLGEVLKLVDVYDPRFCVAVIAILFNPFFWNVVARWEHRTRGLSRLFGSPFLACYCLGFLIILLNVYRSHSMAVVMKAQARWEMLDRPEVFYAGVGLIVAGTLLVSWLGL